MAKEKFNIKNWLDTKPTENTVKFDPISNVPTAKDNEIETLIQRIEDAKTDITTNYNDWLNIGFALSDELGESGRSYFHRLSAFYAGYSKTECDLQYNKCLKANGHGITIKSLFYSAKQAGISIKTNKTTTKITEDTIPTIPDKVYTQLPDFLRRVVSPCASSDEKDIMLLGTLTTISACLPNVFGFYDGKRIYPNLYLFITAQASAGKGRLVHCKQIVKPIHAEMRNQAAILKQRYEIDLADYNSRKGKEQGLEKPEKPKEKMLFIPANNSTTGVFQLLSDNDGKGLIFETEGDTLAQAFKSDYGNYSDGFRKAFHHETISYYRRTDREYVDIDNPCLSTVLSGTPKQITSLIPNAENGLFSRFIFYFMNIRTQWKDVFSLNAANGLDDHYDQLGQEFYALYQMLKENPEIEFQFSSSQKEQFNRYFEEIQDEYFNLQGAEYLATIRRLGLMAFRMALILNILRISETGEISNPLICNDQDFQSTLSIIQTLVQHAEKVFSELPANEVPAKRKNVKELFLDQLPLHFNRQDYLAVASTLSIGEKAAEKYITQFKKSGKVHRQSHNKYINTLKEKANSPNKEV